MGVSLLIFFVLLNFTLGLVSVALAHIAFCIGFVAIVVRARLAGMDESLVEAARDCGATPLQAFALRHAAADHARRDRRRADGVHAVDRRLRDHVLHRGRGHRDAAAADLLDDQDRGDARGQRGVNAAHAADVAADRHRVEGVARACCVRTRRKPAHEEARRRPARASARAAGVAAKDQLHLYNWNNYIAPETVKRFEDVVQVRGRADLLLGQRGAAGQARGGRQGLRRAGADRQRRAGAGPRQPAEAARQGGAAQHQERRPGVPRTPSSTRATSIRRRTRCRRRSSATTTRR